MEEVLAGRDQLGKSKHATFYQNYLASTADASRKNAFLSSVYSSNSAALFEGQRRTGRPMDGLSVYRSDLNRGRPAPIEMTSTHSTSK